MPEPVNLEDVMTDAIQDAQEPEQAEPQDAPETVQDASGDATDTTAETSTSEVQSPATAQADAPEGQVEDEFAKKHGLPAQLPGQRENRIPYSRVKKISENAVKEATTPLQAKVTEYETKVKDYEGRLQQVARFEQVMMTNPEQFFQILDRIPVYHQFFEELGKRLQSPAAQAELATPAVDPNAGRPEPDQALPDGTKVYSLEGLDKLNAWNRAQARKETLAEVDKLYGGTFKSLQEQQQADAWYRQQIPVVEQQVADARKWPNFAENEAEIVQILAANPKVSLEAAYRHVVVPKLQVAQEKLRADVRKQVLGELKRAPQATSVASSATRPGAKPTTSGPRNLEDIIAESIAGMRQD